MPKDNEVDENVIWTTDRPTVEGAYYVRGFNLFRNDQYEALVQVRMHHYCGEPHEELCCNLHASTSEENMDDWVPVIDLQEDFEWSGPLAPPATVAELRAEVERLRDQCVNLQKVVGQYKAERLEAVMKADAAERRLWEVREVQRTHYGDGVGLHLAMIRWARDYDALTGADPT